MEPVSILHLYIHPTTPYPLCDAVVTSIADFSFSHAAGVPQVHHFGQEGLHNVLVIDLLGPNLEDLFDMCGRKFTIKTVCMAAKQMVSLVPSGFQGCMRSSALHERFGAPRHRCPGLCFRAVRGRNIFATATHCHSCLECDTSTNKG